MPDIPRNKHHEREALLFAAAVRALGVFGFSNLSFDIGGKKARRRHVSGLSPTGETLVIWTKSAEHWRTMANVIRFPWKKLAVGVDGQRAVSEACKTAAHLGATHFLALDGDDQTGVLSFARLYPLTQLPDLVRAQSKLCTSSFYRSHNATFILEGHSPEFVEAAKVATSAGDDILNPRIREASTDELETGTRYKSRKTYLRNPKVRAQVLSIADGRCECCGALGFITGSGDRYLETHHVVGVSERGPDSVDNVIAVCPMCHRKAHFAADRVQVEKQMLETIRRRGRRS